MQCLQSLFLPIDMIKLAVEVSEKCILRPEKLKSWWKDWSCARAPSLCHNLDSCCCSVKVAVQEKWRRSGGEVEQSNFHFSWRQYVKYCKTEQLFFRIQSVFKGSICTEWYVIKKVRISLSSCWRGITSSFPADDAQQGASHLFWQQLGALGVQGSQVVWLVKVSTVGSTNSAKASIALNVQVVQRQIVHCASSASYSATHSANRSVQLRCSLSLSNISSTNDPSGGSFWLLPICLIRYTTLVWNRFNQFIEQIWIAQNIDMST